MMATFHRSLLLAFVVVTSTTAYQTQSNYPILDRRALAGLWRLIPRPLGPIKEFTVHKNKQQQLATSQAEVLLMLREDGSFVQQHQQEEEDIDASWKRFQQLKEHHGSADLKGVWDFVDGKLILAADRKELSEKTAAKDGKPTLQAGGDKDTLLVGRVVATYGSSQGAQPPSDDQAKQDDDEDSATNRPFTKQKSNRLSGTRKSKAAAFGLDTHLSVPRGSVKVGRFFYPKTHPSFFEQPMFQPERSGAFLLKQVLGSLNTDSPDDEEIEKFHVSDFYNKTFLLTSQPLGLRRPKGRPRWSMKQNKMVYDPPSKEAQAAYEKASSPGHGIRVMQVSFHANNTFSTIAGSGSESQIILRGKFDVIGRDRDHLWMQIWRFGFGRSVSGSVYSEGKGLSHEDAKSYWGMIYDVAETAKEEDEEEAAPTAEAEQKLEVKGSVLFGSGLEPMPVGKFIMRETNPEDNFLLMDEEAEDEEDRLLASLENDDDSSSSSLPKSDGIDWSEQDDVDAFQ